MSCSWVYSMFVECISISFNNLMRRHSHGHSHFHTKIRTQTLTHPYIHTHYPFVDSQFFQNLTPRKTTRQFFQNLTPHQTTRQSVSNLPQACSLEGCPRKAGSWQMYLSSFLIFHVKMPVVSLDTEMKPISPSCESDYFQIQIDAFQDDRSYIRCILFHSAGITRNYRESQRM